MVDVSVAWCVGTVLSAPVSLSGGDRTDRKESRERGEATDQPSTAVIRINYVDVTYNDSSLV